jgi:SpoIID/LytB domain protein
MDTTARVARPVLRRCLAGLAATALALGGAVATATPSSAAAEKITLSASALTITTSGWGHGRGMSQYGAQGAAKQGLKHAEILGFYYPGTKLEKLKKDDTIRVWITADTDNKVHVYAAKGLRVRDSKGTTFTLPTGKNYSKWRLSRSGSKTVLYHRNAKGKYVKYAKKLKLDPKQQWAFENPTSGKVKLYLASGNRTYRGSLALGFHGKGARTVNHVSMEDYLRSVVPSEMPASWHTQALQAQTVAARSYAARYRANLGGKQVYDICNTASCQVYKGTMTEHGNTDKAVKATAGKVLTYKGQYAWTEFSSSNGGYSVAGPNDYIIAQKDPYDAAMKQIRDTTIKTSKIEAKYPKIGKLKSITLQRDGKGLWGGRVTQVTLTGSKASQKIAGTSFKSALGLRETLFTIDGSVSTLSPNQQRWEDDFGGASGKLLGKSTADEESRDGGQYAAFEYGALWWSKATGSHRLSPAANAAYLEAGGPAKSELGFPKTDEYDFTEQLADDFAPATRIDFESGMMLCQAKASKAEHCQISLG